ncbi:hypothetical protein RYX36_000591 [Vicia faba]
MNDGYSKIGSTTSHKSRSIDFSQTPKPIKISSTTLDEGEKFGAILGRSSSVSSSSYSESGFQATMKRVFSITRSSSVSERYSRIHDQNMVIASDDATKKKKLRGAKILKVCKSLFGFY